jgi:hypothetical protein
MRKMTRRLKRKRRWIRRNSTLMREQQEDINVGEEKVGDEKVEDTKDTQKREEEKEHDEKINEEKDNGGRGDRG